MNIIEFLINTKDIEKRKKYIQMFYEQIMEEKNTDKLLNINNYKIMQHFYQIYQKSKYYDLKKYQLDFLKKIKEMIIEHKNNDIKKKLIKVLFYIKYNIQNPIIIGITGHTNIEKTEKKELIKNGFEYNKKVYDKIMQNIENKLKKEFNTNDIDIIFVSGMARGIDEIFADIALKYNYPLILAIPHSIKWHKNRDKIQKDKIRKQAINYDKFLNYPKSEIFEIKKNYGKIHKYVNFARNEFMVDICDKFYSYSVYDSSGTNNGIFLSKKKGNYSGNLYSEPNLYSEYNINL